MYLKYGKDFTSIDAQIVSITQPFINAKTVSIARTLVCRNCFELSIKLFKFRLRARKVVITFVVIVFFLKFS